jgi:hypothetical protein
LGRRRRASHRPRKAPKTAKGVPKRTLRGRVQLSYWAARMRKTITMARMKTVAPVPAALFSW